MPKRRIGIWNCCRTQRPISPVKIDILPQFKFEESDDVTIIDILKNPNLPILENKLRRVIKLQKQFPTHSKSIDELEKKRRKILSLRPEIARKDAEVRSKLIFDEEEAKRTISQSIKSPISVIGKSIGSFI